MSTRTHILRLVAGAAVAIAIVAIAFALILPWMHTWGATPAEIAAVWPGDELTPAPEVAWTHAVTIRATPDQVWPWIAQLGEGRGGYYSYTFIENLISGGNLYRNARSILPEFQQPQPGVPMIGGMLQIRESQAGRYLIAEAMPGAGIGWSWVWAIAPADGGQATRLVIRMKIDGRDNKIPAPAVFFLDAGGLIMERKMIQELRDRAEGRIEPAWVQPVEIALWIAALLAGVAAAVLFLKQRRWFWPLVVGLAAILVLLVFTYLQPELWLRGILLIGLLAGLMWARRFRELAPLS